MTVRRRSIAHMIERMPTAFPKRCSCGAVYHEDGWQALPQHGKFPGVDERTGRRFGRDLEIRVCTCGSSIAVEVKGS